MTLPAAAHPFDRRTLLAGGLGAPFSTFAARAARAPGSTPLTLEEVLVGAEALVARHLGTPLPNDEAWVHGATALLAQLGALPPDPFAAMTAREATFLREHGWTFRRVERRPADGARPAILTHQIHVPANGRIPLHDHRGMFGAIVGIDGEVEIRSYDVVEGGTATAEVVLQKTARTWLAPGRFALLTRSRDNVHEFRAGAKPVRMLDLFVWLDDTAQSHDLQWIDDPDAPRADRRYRARWR
jgi:hypothetical protein